MVVPQKKLNIELLYDSIILLMGTDSKELKARIRTDICTPIFTAVLFTKGKKDNLGQPKLSIDYEWINKMWYIHLYQMLLLK